MSRALRSDDKRPKRASRRGDLGQAEYERLAEFRYLLRQFLAFSEDAATGAGLTAQQHQALLAIRGRPGPDPLTIGALAERLSIQPHSAVGLIDRLEAKGLIRRGGAAGDRRQVLLELTEGAETLLSGLSVAHRNELKRLAPLLRGLLAAFDPPKGK
jgi:DNA-binding MarR family transcriptional regulator